MASLCSKPTGLARLPGGEGGDLSVNCRPACHATGYLLLKQGRHKTGQNYVHAQFHVSTTAGDGMDLFAVGCVKSEFFLLSFQHTLNITYHLYSANASVSKLWRLSTSFRAWGRGWAAFRYLYHSTNHSSSLTPKRSRP